MVSRFQTIFAIVSSMLVVGVEPRALWSQERCQMASLNETQAMAIMAAELLLATRPQTAFLIFHGLNGRIWVNAVFPVVPGPSIMGPRDRNGPFFVQEMIEVTQNEGYGWTEYAWFSPCIGEMESKSTHVARIVPTG